MPRLLTVRTLMAALLIGAPACEVHGAERLAKLSATDIQQKLVDKRISYSPPGWADAGIGEAFSSDGTWSATIYSVAIHEVPGKWTIQHNELCVIPDRAAPMAKMFVGLRCRAVWRGASNKEVLIKHLYPMMSSSGLLVASITKLTASR